MDATPAGLLITRIPRFKSRSMASQGFLTSSEEYQSLPLSPRYLEDIICSTPLTKIWPPENLIWPQAFQPDVSHLHKIEPHLR